MSLSTKILLVSWLVVIASCKSAPLRRGKGLSISSRRRSSDDSSDSSDSCEVVHTGVDDSSRRRSGNDCQKFFDADYWYDCTDENGNEVPCSPEESPCHDSRGSCDDVDASIRSTCEEAKTTCSQTCGVCKEPEPPSPWVYVFLVLGCACCCSGCIWWKCCRTPKDSKEEEGPGSVEAPPVKPVVATVAQQVAPGTVVSSLPAQSSVAPPWFATPVATPVAAPAADNTDQPSIEQPSTEQPSTEQPSTEQRRQRAFLCCN